MTDNIALEAPPLTDGLVSRQMAARALVASLEVAAAVAAGAGQPVDAAALAQARCELDALGGALAAATTEERAKAAAAERESIAVIRRQIGTEGKAWLAAIDEAEAGALAMVGALRQAASAAAKITLLSHQLDEPIALGPHTTNSIIARALCDTLRTLTAGAYTFGDLTLANPLMPSGQSWRDALRCQAEAIADIAQKEPAA